MPTPLEIARSENRNFLLFSDEDLIDRLYDQYQDRYPNKQLFTEFLTTDVDQFDKGDLKGDMGRKPKKRGNPAVIKEEPMRDRMKQPLKRKKP